MCEFQCWNPLTREDRSTFQATLQISYNTQRLSRSILICRSVLFTALHNKLLFIESTSTVGVQIVGHNTERTNSLHSKKYKVKKQINDECRKL